MSQSAQPAINTLHYDALRKAFVFRTTFDDRDIPKDAGFKWSPEGRYWATRSARVASQLLDYCPDAATAQQIRDAVAAEAAKQVAVVEASRAQSSDINIPCPDGLAYLPFQRAGIAYAIDRSNALIADEMGLGKTVQALGVANSEIARRGKIRMLVVCPKIAVCNWRNEAQRWLMGGCTVGVGTTKAWPDTDLIITNYDILNRPDVKARLNAKEWDVVVFDEAHALKNPSAARTKAAIGGGKGPDRVAPIPARRRLFLTGSPILNRPSELYPMLHAMRCDFADNFFRYAERYCAGISTRFGFDASGASNLGELEVKLRSSVMVRRRKADVLTDLPEKRHEVVALAADDPAQRKALADEGKAIAALKAARGRAMAAVRKAEAGGDQEAYRAAVASMRAGKGVEFAEMARVRRETAVSKVPQVVEHVVGVAQSVPDAVLVFAHHKEVIDGIAKGLREAGIQPAIITGETSDKDREAAQGAIQGGQKRVFIGSMRACGVAITLTAASTVIFAEQDWTPGVMRQAEDRAHRIGQRNSVLVQSIVLDGSFDADMAKTVAAKGQVIDEALDGLDLAAERASPSAAAKRAARQGEER